MPKNWGNSTIMKKVSAYIIIDVVTDNPKISIIINFRFWNVIVKKGIANKNIKDALNLKKKWK